MTGVTGMSESEAEIIIRREGRAGRVTLNRPKALNALTYEQLTATAEVLEVWRSDPSVQLVLLDGAGERAFCAGGDVLSLYQSRKDGPGFARQFWRDEYHLNAAISHYPKPVAVIQEGIVMGGGIGLSSHASHRIVTERSQLAMPETTIGLVPDVGGLWLLANAPGRLGEYLGLLGERMNAADAIFAGFSDTCVRSERHDELIAALVDPDGDPVGVTVAGFADAPPPVVLADHVAEIDEIFEADTLEEILARLSASPSGWAQKATASAQSRSPLSMKLTLAGVRAAREMSSLEDALNLEYRLTTRLFEHGEFIEGIRALLVDKDKAPRWNPATLAEVTNEMVAAFLAPFGDRPELGLLPPK